jgi:hypothetical protein
MNSDSSAPAALPGVEAVPSAPTISQADSGPARPWGFWATLGLTAANLLVVVFVVLGLDKFVALVGTWMPSVLPAGPKAGMVFWPALSTVVGALVAVGFAWFCASRRPGIRAGEYLALKPAPPNRLGYWCLIMVVVLAINDILAVMLGSRSVPDFLRHAYASAGFVPLLWLAFVVAGPVAEELVFRGFAFTGLQSSRLGNTGTIVLTAAVWACLHFQYGPFGIAQIFALGLLLGQARLDTGTILVPTVMHALMNLKALVIVAGILHRSPG